MSQSQEMRDKIHRLENRLSELVDETIQIQSDIYDIQMKLSGLHINMENIVSYLEAHASKGGLRDE